MTDKAAKTRADLARENARYKRISAQVHKLRVLAHKTRARIVLNKRRLLKLEAYRPGAAAAIRWASARVGITENPAGSNRGPDHGSLGGVTTWQRSFGGYLVGLAWCGVLLGCALRAAGVKVTARIAGVANIEDDARAGVNGFRSWSDSASTAQPGDAVVLFGRGVHVELVVSVNLARRELETIGGNTGFGPGGSQSNGGCVAARTRSFNDVHGIAHVAYPK